MDAAAGRDEVRLRKGSPLRERLIWAGSGAVLLLLLVPGLLMWASDGRPLLVALWAAPLGLFLIGVALLELNIAWIVTRDGIVIGEQRPLGQVRKRMVDYREIADISVRKNRFSYPASFSLACGLASGDVLVSPPLPDITRVNETAATVADLLGLPEAILIDNPLDAANAAITLGSPVSSSLVRVVRMAAPVLVMLCILSVTIAFWIGQSELALGFLLPLGLILAFTIYRNANRLSGAFWVIRHGEIHIERMTWNGSISVEAITAADVAAIEADKPDRKGRTCTVSIRLHNGRTFRSPTRYDENGASAVRAEIIRRLNAPADTGTLTG
jgi:hypothetical protein